MEMWTRYKVELAVRNRVVGGVPTDPALIAGWIKANMPAVDEAERVKLAKKTVEELGEAAEEKAESMWTTFKKDDDGIYIEDRQIKAMFKESANILRDILIKNESKSAKPQEPAEPAAVPATAVDKEKAKKAKAAAKSEAKSRYTNLKARLAERLFVEEQHVHFVRDGKPLSKPDGNEERAIHVMGAQGPRDALKRVDFVSAPADIQFTIRVLNDGKVDEELIRTLLEHSAWNGLGADRSQGNGLFTVASLAKV